MTQDDIIRMAREAGFEIDCCSLEWHDRIERFAQLVAAHESEECAKVADKWAVGWPHPSTVIAEEIRARKNK
jgi:predicted 3-demethylubiquinone-9 3-methyltransferase (glyoxalase superfamily)